MANINETQDWEAGVYQLEQTDLVLAGADGIANLQAKQLAARTKWLKAVRRGFDGATFLTASKTLTLAEVTDKLVVLSPGADLVEYTLPNADLQAGLKVNFIVQGATKQVAIKAAVADQILFNSTTSQRIYLADGEKMELMWLGTKWLVLDYTGNFTSVGDFDYGYTVKTNTVIANGSVLNRSDYPRLWQFAASLGLSLITENTWVNTPNSRGFFSAGNGTTTFRVPDLRGLFIRSLDLGAGIDLGRPSESSGGFEDDEVKSHKHKSNSPNFYWRTGGAGPLRKEDGNTAIIGVPVGYPFSGTSLYDISKRETIPSMFEPQPGISGYDYQTAFTENFVGAETRPKNIGLIPLIKI